MAVRVSRCLVGDLEDRNVARAGSFCGRRQWPLITGVLDQNANGTPASKRDVFEWVYTVTSDGRQRRRSLNPEPDVRNFI